MSNSYYNYKFLNFGLTQQNKALTDSNLNRSSFKTQLKELNINERNFAANLTNTVTNNTHNIGTFLRPKFVHNDWSKNKKNFLADKGSACRLLKLKANKSRGSNI